mmetsp:Transcript_164584/g.527983  ORF Transcript_164584/g.527983 Transcript_164584/m.527983 type:complete len:86 (+) Transcript_164584:2001-2258(+)
MALCALRPTASTAPATAATAAARVPLPPLPTTAGAAAEVAPPPAPAAADRDSWEGAEDGAEGCSASGGASRRQRVEPARGAAVKQ